MPNPVAYTILSNTDPKMLADAVSAAIVASASGVPLVPAGGPVLDARGIWYQALGIAADSGGSAGNYVAQGAAGDKPADLVDAPTAADFNDLVAQLNTAKLFTQQV